MGLDTTMPLTGPLTLQFAPGSFSEESFYAFCRLNRDLRIERDAEGNLLVMPSANSETGAQNSRLNYKFQQWDEATGLGIVFDSSAGFTLPDSSVLSPDVSWIRRERWNAVPSAERQRFAAIVPDFVLELRSASDALNRLRQKMKKYLRNGVRLAWLVDPVRRATTVYRAGRPEPWVVPFAEPLSGEDVLPGFTLVLGDLLPD